MAIMIVDDIGFDTVDKWSARGRFVKPLKFPYYKTTNFIIFWAELELTYMGGGYYEDY